MSTVKALLDDDFEATLKQQPGLVLVDFGGEHCSACKALEPVLRALAQERPDVRIFSMDVEESPKTSDVFDVRGLPTLLLFRDGVLVDRLIGYQSPARLKGVLDRHSPTSPKR